MTPDPIDAAVRRHLDREASTVDAAAMLARVKAAPPVRRRRWDRLAAAAGLVGLAAAITVAFTLGGSPQVRSLTAAEMVRQARLAHATPADRCYQVTAAWNPVPLQRLKLDPFVQESRLWTRGDQFWLRTVGPAGRPTAWGQDSAGQVWVALGPKRGLVYEPSEIGEPLAKYADLMSLRVVSTLGDLLGRYDLTRVDDGPDRTVRIAAKLRDVPGNPLPARFTAATLDLDPDTKVIQKAVLERQANGETVGTLTFTLVESGTLGADQYELSGHLDRDAVILDGKPPVPPGIGLPRPGSDPRARLRDEFLRRAAGKK